MVNKTAAILHASCSAQQSCVHHRWKQPWRFMCLYCYFAHISTNGKLIQRSWNFTHIRRCSFRTVWFSVWTGTNLPINVSEKKAYGMNWGAFITHWGIYLNVSLLWERHVRPTWGYGMSAGSGGVGRLSGQLTEVALWTNMCFWSSYRNYTAFYWCMLFSLTPMGPIIAGVCR